MQCLIVRHSKLVAALLEHRLFKDFSSGSSTLNCMGHGRKPGIGQVPIKIYAQPRYHR